MESRVLPCSQTPEAHARGAGALSRRCSPRASHCGQCFPRLSLSYESCLSTDPQPPYSVYPGFTANTRDFLG